MHPQYTKKERKYKPMSDTILALLGFATVIAVIVLLLRNVTVPALAFVSVSTITAAILVATGAFTLDEMAGFIKEGVKGVHGTAVLFIFSVLFFGVMTDAGMFDKIIGALMKKVGNNVVGVALMTCLIAIIGHLDGGGASTFLITIPAMLPVYKRLHMRRETLLLICVTAMGVMNLMPWGGPTMRAASVIEMEPNDLWFQLMPMQIVGLVLAVGTAIFWGLQEKKRIAKLGDAIVAEDAGKYDDSDDGKKDETLARPQNFIFNVILTLAVIIVLVLDIFPSYYVFMVGCALGILVNYRGKKLHNSIIKSHASAGLSMASTILWLCCSIPTPTSTACCPFWSALATSSASTRLTSPSQWSSAATALPSSARWLPLPIWASVWPVSRSRTTSSTASAGSGVFPSSASLLV